MGIKVSKRMVQKISILVLAAMLFSMVAEVLPGRTFAYAAEGDVQTWRYEESISSLIAEPEGTLIDINAIYSSAKTTFYGSGSYTDTALNTGKKYLVGQTFIGEPTKGNQKSLSANVTLTGGAGAYKVEFYNPLTNANNDSNAKFEITGKNGQVTTVTVSTVNAGWITLADEIELDATAVIKGTGMSSGKNIRYDSLRFTEVNPSAALRMDVRTSSGSQPSFTAAQGVTLSGTWNATTGLSGSTSAVGSLWASGASADTTYAIYQPNKSGSTLEAGNYNVYFWYVYHSGNAMNLKADVLAGGDTFTVDQQTLTASGGSKAQWVKVGTYAFTGAEEEYLKLTATGYARIADVKFEKTDEPAATPTPTPAPTPTPSSTPANYYKEDFESMTPGPMTLASASEKTQWNTGAANYTSAEILTIPENGRKAMALTGKPGAQGVSGKQPQ